MDMNNELYDFILHSKIGELIQTSGITDISYNGANLFYQHNLYGRRKAVISYSSKEALDFIRQIANMSEKQFSYTNPILDVSIKNLRINAVHSSIVRVEDEKSLSFSIRIGSITSPIENNKSFMKVSARKIIKKMIDQGMSIVIAGQTGSGKTELQKYLLSSLKDNSRIIVIDNIQELDSIRRNENLDVTSWQLNDNVVEGTFERLIRNALRSNPDWLVIAESRGKEMNDVLNSVLTGHPIITTLHADDIYSIPNRITKMVEMSKTTETYEEIYDDVIKHIRGYIYLRKKTNKKGEIIRYISEIALSNKKELEIVYSR